MFKASWAVLLLTAVSSTCVKAWSMGGFAKPATIAQPLTPPANVKVLILPGFGNDPIDYELPQAPEGSLIRSLQARGWTPEQIRTLPMKRSDWFQVFWRGCLDPQFWAGNAPPTRPAFAWYLDRIQSTVQEMCETSNDDDVSVVLLAHSAGGWLARAALGSVECDDKASLREKVVGLVTLGTPHMPPPPEIMDMTRGALLWTDKSCPGAMWKDDMFYLTVMGNAITGQPQERKSPFEPRSVAAFAHDSYTQVCGIGTTTGDGVVPLCAGHLEGAKQLTLDGVFHSINAPASWYGSDVRIDDWHSIVLQELGQRVQTKQTKPSAPSLFSLFGR